MPVNFDDLVHLRLRAARMARGFRNRSAFAELCATPLTTYRAHETGEYELRVSDALKYAKILDISIMWLVTGKGDPLDHLATPDPQESAVFHKLMKIEFDNFKMLAEQHALKCKIKAILEGGND